MLRVPRVLLERPVPRVLRVLKALPDQRAPPGQPVLPERPDPRAPPAQASKGLLALPVPRAPLG